MNDNRNLYVSDNLTCVGIQGNQQNRAMMLNSKVVDYINYILRAAEFKNCDSEKVWHISIVMGVNVNCFCPSVELSLQLVQFMITRQTC